MTANQMINTMQAAIDNLNQRQQLAAQTLIDGLEYAQNEDDPERAGQALVGAVETALGLLAGSQSTKNGEK